VPGGVDVERAYRVAVVDDESESLAAMSRALRKVGYEVTSFEDAEAALGTWEMFKDIDLVVSDLKMPRTSGLDLLKKVRAVNQEAGFLIVTGHGTVETAVDAMKAGADDYILKPLDLYELRERVHHILETRKARIEIRELLRGLGEGIGIENLVANSPAMKMLLEQLAVAAPTRSTVLLLGESGTGKDLMAQALHRNSTRRREIFFPINCAALSPTLLESELFGHEKGAFTGASDRRAGKLELADKGTLFLDEIGEMPLDMQVKLLRFLETREFMRVGGGRLLKLDVRIIAATNRELNQAVEEGKFRKDLYFRLKVVTFQIPPLRERKEDIPLLVGTFLKVFAEEHGKPILQVAPEAMEALAHYPWPGNVRELRNLMENFVLFARGDILQRENLPAEVLKSWIDSRAVLDELKAASGVPVETDREVLPMAEIEKQAILRALEKTGGNRLKAAQMLGIGLRTLQSKLKEYGMTGR
jgi:DNA-binding NtrC family response regulator